MLADYLHSPVQPSHFGGRAVWWKREDLALNGLGNNKLRKAHSLLPALLARQPAGLALIGGAYSNNVLALATLATAQAVPVHAFLRGEPTLRNEGNLQRLRGLLPEEHLHWVARTDWAEVEQIAGIWAEAQGYALVPEGAFQPQAIPGAATLAADIARNEQELGLRFSHVWLDAGTGLTAIATLLADAGAGRHYHIVLVAGTTEEFEQILKQIVQMQPTLLPPYTLYMATLAPGFGRITAAVRAYAATFAQEQGIQPDLVYTASLLATAQPHLAGLQGEVLLVLSGGQQG